MAGIPVKPLARRQNPGKLCGLNPLGECFMQRQAIAIAALCLTAWAAPASSARAASFDGTWAVTVNCPREAGGARGYTYHFAAQVTRGALHGQKGRANAPGSLTIDGHIGPDGAASFNAHGVVNDSAYARKHRAMGAKYAYTATGHFSAQHGSAHRTSGRTCNYSFTKR